MIEHYVIPHNYLFKLNLSSWAWFWISVWSMTVML